MKRYRFRLEVILRVRRAEETAAQGELVRANARLREAIMARDHAQERYRSFVSARPAPTDRASLQMDQLDASVFAEMASLAQSQAMDAARETALAQVRWADAARRVAVLERLDERRRAEHAAEERHHEVAMVDDLVTARWASRDEFDTSEDPPLAEVGAREVGAREVGAREVGAREVGI